MHLDAWVAPSPDPAPDDTTVTEPVCALMGHRERLVEAERTITALTAERDAARAGLARVESLHRTNGFPVEACLHDGCQWPCPTAALLGGKP